MFQTWSQCPQAGHDATTLIRSRRRHRHSSRLVMAQMASSIDNTELSKESDNPVSRMIKLPLRYEAEFDSGAFKETKDTFAIDEAIVPFRLSENWSLITRTKLPYEALPPKKVRRRLGVRSQQRLHDLLLVS